MKKELLTCSVLLMSAMAFASPPVIDRTDVRIDRTGEMRVPEFLMHSTPSQRHSSIQLFENKPSTPPFFSYKRTGR